MEEMGNKTEPLVICPKMFFAQESGQGITQSCILRAEEQASLALFFPPLLLLWNSALTLSQPGET